MTTKRAKKLLSTVLSVVMVLSLFPFALPGASAADAEVPMQPSDYLLGKYFSNSWAWYDAVSEQNQLEWKAGWPEYSAEKDAIEFQAGNGNTNTYLRIITRNLFAGVSESTGLTFSYTYTPGLGDWHRHILSLGAGEYSGSSNPNNHFYISATNSWLNRDAGNIWTVPVIGYVDGNGVEHIQAMPQNNAPAFEIGRTYNITVTISVDEGVRYNIDGTDYGAIYYDSNLEAQKQYIRAFLNSVAGWQYNYIGCSRWADGNFNGYLKDLCLYGKAFTKEELDAPVVYSEAFIARARQSFNVDALALPNSGFNGGVTVIDGNPVAADYYSNVVYSNGMTYYGDGNGFDVSGMYFKFVVPTTLVTVYDGVNDILVPVETETKVHNNSSNVIHAVTSSGSFYSLYQNWVGHMDGVGDNWKTWGSTTQQNPTAHFSYQNNGDVGVDPSECQYLSGGDYQQNNTGTSRFWWNRLKYGGTGNTTVYYQYDADINFSVYASRKPSNSSRSYSGECPFTLGMDHYVINYAPVYAILEDAAALYNDSISGKEWMYTDESLNQAMVALFLIQLSNPNNFEFTDLRTDVRKCASLIRQAVTEYNKIHLVKKSGTVTFFNDDDTVFSAVTADYGETFTVPAVPAKPSTPSTEYTNPVWDPAVTPGSCVMSDEYAGNIYVAQYTPTARLYSVRFFDLNNNQIGDTQQVAYGAAAQAPTLPAKTPDADNHYTVAWDTGFSAVTGDTDVHAVATPVAHYGGRATCQSQAECEACHTLYGTLGAHAYGVLHAAVPPSCTEPGYVAYYQCSVCGDYFDEAYNEIDSVTVPAGHTYGEWIPEQAATCDTNGVKGHYHCGVCGKDFDAEYNELNDLTIPAAHTYGEWIPETPASCAAAGEKGHYHCSICGGDFDASDNAIEDLVIPRAAHAYGEWTPLGDGTHTRTCANCPAGTDGHAETESCSVGTAATCQNKAVCGVCGGEFGALAGHTYGAWIPETAASCEGEGTLGHYHCGVCGRDFDAEYNELNDLTIPAAHVYGEWIPETPATCAAVGEKGHYHCSGCGRDFDAEHNVLGELTVPKADHSYGDWYTDVGGTHSRVCAVCPEGTEGHKQTETCSGGTAATCVQRSLCGVCGGEYGDLADHAYGEWIAETTAGCFTPGELGHYHCAVCGGNFDADRQAVADLSIPQIGHHTLQHTAAKDAGCPNTTGNGNTEYWRCLVCGKYFSDAAGENETSVASIVIRAAHVPVWVEERAATATEAGMKAHYDCALCGRHYSDEACDNELSEADLRIAPENGDIGELSQHVCPICGRRHGSTFWERATELVHLIVYLVLSLMGKI